MYMIYIIHQLFNEIKMRIFVYNSDREKYTINDRTQNFI